MKWAPDEINAHFHFPCYDSKCFKASRDLQEMSPGHRSSGFLDKPGTAGVAPLDANSAAGVRFKPPSLAPEMTLAFMNHKRGISFSLGTRLPANGGVCLCQS